MTGGNPVTIEGAINNPPTNLGEGIEPQSGIIQSQNCTTVTYTNKPTEFVFYKVESTGGSGVKGTPLSGATFALYELTSGNADDYKDKLVETNASGEPSSGWKFIAKVTSKDDGIISFTGINHRATEFRLVELTAPPGYTVPTGQWRIVFDEKTETFVPVIGASAVKNPPGIETITPVDGIQYQIRNYKPQDLPSSGNTGIGWFMKTGGALMISSALLMFVLAQRRKKQDLNKDSQE